MHKNKQYFAISYVLLINSRLLQNNLMAVSIMFLVLANILPIVHLIVVVTKTTCFAQNMYELLKFICEKR
jgi:hypothetical protein